MGSNTSGNTLFEESYDTRYVTLNMANTCGSLSVEK